MCDRVHRIGTGAFLLAFALMLSLNPSTLNSAAAGMTRADMAQRPASLAPAAPAAGGKECVPVVFVHGITGSAPEIGSTLWLGAPQYPFFSLLEANKYKEGETLFRFADNWAASNSSSAGALAAYVDEVKDKIEKRIGGVVSVVGGQFSIQLTLSEALPTGVWR